MWESPTCFFDYFRLTFFDSPNSQFAIKAHKHFHHHEVVAMAITRLEEELKGPRREDVLRQSG